jgi:type II secretory pathway component PulM
VLKQYWSHLDNASQQRLIAAVVVIGLLFCWQFVWQPLQRHHAAVANELAQRQQLLIWMQETQKTIADVGVTAQGVSVDDLQQVVGRLAQEQRIKVSRIQRMSDGRAMLQLEQCDFSRVISLLNQLNTRAISLETISIHRTESDGKVNVRMVLSN